MLATYRCYSIAWDSSHAGDLECGDRIILPADAFREAHLLKLKLPLLFTCTNPLLNSNSGEDTVAPQLCGVQEFSAPSGTAFMPSWLLQDLRIREGGNVQLSTAPCPLKATFARFQPLSSEFLDVAATQGAKPFMEAVLRSYSTLIKGRCITVQHDGVPYKLRVVDVAPHTPSDGVSVMGDLDMEVDFKLPPNASRPSLKAKEGGKSQSVNMLPPPASAKAQHCQLQENTAPALKLKIRSQMSDHGRKPQLRRGQVFCGEGYTLATVTSPTPSPKEPLPVALLCCSTSQADIRATRPAGDCITCSECGKLVPTANLSLHSFKCGRIKPTDNTLAIDLSSSLTYEPTRTNDRSITAANPSNNGVQTTSASTSRVGPVNKACKWCELTFSLEHLVQHEDVCGARTERCDTCGVYVQRRNQGQCACTGSCSPLTAASSSWRRSSPSLSDPSVGRMLEAARRASLQSSRVAAEISARNARIYASLHADTPHQDVDGASTTHAMSDDNQVIAREWTCHACTLINPCSIDVCQACDGPRQSSPSPTHDIGNAALQSRSTTTLPSPPADNNSRAVRSALTSSTVSDARATGSVPRRIDRGSATNSNANNGNTDLAITSRSGTTVSLGRTATGPGVGQASKLRRRVHESRAIEELTGLRW